MPLSSKIHPREKVAIIVEKLRKEGKKVGVTNGVFDILHAGHVTYLENAKKICDVLVVSLNTDESVRSYKDANRPINPQQDRAQVIAGLSSVDYVTFHPERRMRDTLLALKPDFYIKGGDYNSSSLTSQDVLSQWGGEIRLIPLLPGYSTTKIFETIVHRYAENTIQIENPIPEEKQKAVILDRDGVINEQVDYLHDPDKFQLLPGVAEGLRELQNLGYLLVIATNQSGIGFGYFAEEDFYRVNKHMLSLLHKQGITISKIYFCPHTLAQNCLCRKPKTGLLERAVVDLNLDVAQTWMIGDRSTDILAGGKMHFKTVLIETGKGESYDSVASKPDFIAKDLKKAASIIQVHS